MQPNWPSTKTSLFLHLSSQMLNEPTATHTFPPHFPRLISDKGLPALMQRLSAWPYVTSACRISARAEPTDCVLSFVCLEGCLKRCFPGAMTDLQKPEVMLLLLILWWLRRNSPCVRVSDRTTAWATGLTVQRFILNLAQDRELKPGMWLGSIFLPRCS